MPLNSIPLQAIKKTVCVCLNITAINIFFQTITKYLTDTRDCQSSIDVKINSIRRHGYMDLNILAGVNSSGAAELAIRSKEAVVSAKARIHF